MALCRLTLPKNLARIAAATTAAVLLAGGNAQAANCSADLIDGQLVSIANLESAKVLDVTGGAIEAGARIQQWGLGGGVNQQFYLRDAGAGYWRIEGRQSGLVLDVLHASSAEGASVIQWPWTGSSHQQWLFKKSTTGAYNIVARHSGRSLSVSDTGSGTWVHQASDTASRLQRWHVNPVAGPCGGRRWLRRPAGT